MNRISVVLVLSLILAIAPAVVYTTAEAQLPYAFLPSGWHFSSDQFPNLSQPPLGSDYSEPASLEPGDILVDDFEYWGSPFDHGWERIFTGTGCFSVYKTLLDHQGGSHALHSWRSVFFLWMLILI